MRYVSTRGAAPVLEFEEVLLAGLARDGGLYLPETWPRFGAEDIRALAHLDYGELACARPLARPERPSSRTPLDLGGVSNAPNGPSQAARSGDTAKLPTDG